MIALLTLISEPLGFAINNARLLVNLDYEAIGDTGDFNYLIAICVPVNLLIIVAGTMLYIQDYDFLTVLMMAISSTIILIHKYYMVYFRLQLDYARIFISNMILCIGYWIGLLLFEMSFSWLLIYVIGGLASLIYTLYKNPLIKERFGKTRLLENTLGKMRALLFVEISNSIIRYADRLLLYPLLGGTAVSIYYSATVISKIISLSISPISTVILSYFSRMNELGKRHFLMMVCITAFMGIVGYMICVFMAHPVLICLYPNWADESFYLVFITTATCVVDAINSVIRPAVLKFRCTKWQYWIGSSNAAFYIILSIVFFHFGGLEGFCFGLLANALVQFIFRFWIFMRSDDNAVPFA